jgi:TRAP-type C4-dicarboxylate transport system permease small subunit
MEDKRPRPGPRWYGIVVRVLLVTFLVTLLTFAVSLLLAIIGVVGVAKARGATPYLPLAYRDVALPVACVVGTVALVTSLVMEIRHYRQAKALHGIERAG